MKKIVATLAVAIVASLGAALPAQAADTVTLVSETTTSETRTSCEPPSLQAKVVTTYSDGTVTETWKIVRYFDLSLKEIDCPVVAVRTTVKVREFWGSPPSMQKQITTHYSDGTSRVTTGTPSGWAIICRFGNTVASMNACKALGYSQAVPSTNVVKKVEANVVKRIKQKRINHKAGWVKKRVIRVWSDGNRTQTAWRVTRRF